MRPREHPQTPRKESASLYGVVLAGGRGTRLLPMTRVVNKHLLPVYDQPMIHYPLASLQTANIRRGCVVVGGRQPGGFRGLLGGGSEFGFAELSFVGQEG